MDEVKSFLGRGWAYPPRFDRAVSPTAMISAEEDIRQSLYIILSTRPGERVMRPGFGCRLHQLVFHHIDLTTRTQLIEAVEHAVLYYEPRVILNGVSLDTERQVEGVLLITLEYTIRMTNTRTNLVYPYYYEEYL